VSLTHFYLAEDVTRAPLTAGDGAIALSGRPGLGIEVDEAAVERFQLPS
jgi:L-alanine-DL-glutamate epimerase-like enolase superfamily enzyme